MYLLDINAPLALCDEAHECYERVWAWFTPLRAEGGVTCPLTENGFLCTLEHPAHPSRTGSLRAARKNLHGLCESEGHQFWLDKVSVRNRTQFAELTPGISKTLTNLYRLGLAVMKGGRFATFDRRVDAGLVTGKSRALKVILR